MAKIEVPAEIFKILSEEQFISSDKTISNLYNIIEDEHNFENLYDYFSNNNFVLEKDDEYFYYSRAETKIDLKKK